MTYEQLQTHVNNDNIPKHLGGCSCYAFHIDHFVPATFHSLVLSPDSKSFIANKIISTSDVENGSHYIDTKDSEQKRDFFK